VFVDKVWSLLQTTRLKTAKKVKLKKSVSEKESDYTLKESVRLELNEEAKSMKDARRFNDPEKAKAFLRSCAK
jgi:hypothetical protein